MCNFNITNSDKSILENTENWLKNRAKSNPRNIPRIRSEPKKFSIMIGDILKNSIGEINTRAVFKTRLLYSKKDEISKIENLRKKIKNKNLVLEEIMVIVY